MPSEAGNAPDFDPLNPTEREADEMFAGYRAASRTSAPPAVASMAFEHGWRMRRNDMAGMADDDQRHLARRQALAQGRDQGEGSDG